jgi:hypothetical protein
MNDEPFVIDAGKIPAATPLDPYLLKAWTKLLASDRGVLLDYDASLSLRMTLAAMARLMAKLQPTALQVRHERWVTAIVADIESGKCPLGIIDHIQKHAGHDLDQHLMELGAPGVTDWRRWSASMHNLLAIFDAQFLKDEPMTMQEMLDRFQDQHDRKPNERTPEPV